MLSPPALGSSRRFAGGPGDVPGGRRSSQEALWGRLSSQEARQAVSGRGSYEDPGGRRSSAENTGVPATP